MRLFSKQLLTAALMVSAISLLLTGSALAHVVVKPSEVLTGAFQTFTMGVPNEKDNPVVNLKLHIPAGLEEVSPTVKPGWTIATEKTGTGEDATVTSITWSSGSIPAEQRDDFSFSAKVPDKTAELQWKVYQTYENGVTVAWDQAPDQAKHEDESAPVGPFSVTKVAANLGGSTGPATTALPAKASSDNTTKTIAVAALAVALIALAAATRQTTVKSKK